MEIILNEFSMSPLPVATSQADNAMNELLSILNQIAKKSKKLDLRATESIRDIQIGEKYTVYQWLSKQRAEIKSQFLSFTAQKPFIREDYPEYRFQNQPCKSFAYAYENDWLAISYNPNLNWSETKYVIEKRYLDEQTLDYETETVEVLHISQQAHLVTHQVWIENNLRLLINQQFSKIKTHTDFWESKYELCSHLIFCEEVEAQIASVPFNFLSNAIQKLISMSSMIDAMPSDFFDLDKIQLNISPESETTLTQFSAERTFLCDDGEKRVFDLHIKLANLRIYFYPIPQSKKCWIGYIGKHLRTSKYK